MGNFMHICVCMCIFIYRRILLRLENSKYKTIFEILSSLRNEKLTLRYLRNLKLFCLLTKKEPRRFEKHLVGTQ